MSEKLNILLLEDSQTDVDLIRRVLVREKIDHDLDVVMSKDAFANRLREKKPDIILSDNSLPQFSAVEALTYIHSLQIKLPFILVTGTMSEEFAVEILKSGASDYILKDRLHRLPAAIRQAMQQQKTENQRALAYERLIDSERRYRDLIGRISDGFLSLDNDLVITYLNSIAEDLIGKKANEVTRRSLMEVFPKALDRPFYRAYLQALETGRHTHLEDYSTELDKWLMLSIYPSSTGLSVFFRDITDLRKAELEARKSDELFRTFIERIKDAFIALDSQYRYTYINSKAEHLIQMKAENLIGRNVWEVFPEAIGSKTYQAITRAMETQQYVSNIDFYQPLDLWQENHIYPSSDGLSIFIRDITARKKAEEELRKTNEFLQNVTLATSDLIWELDLQTHSYASYKGKNKSVGQCLPKEPFIGHSPEEIFQDDRHEVLMDFESTRLDKKKKFWEAEYRLQKSEDEVNYVLNHAEFIRSRDGLAVVAIGAIRDITEKKLLQNKLLEQQKKEQLLITASTLQAQEKERNAIGIELHDNVNQILVGSKLLLSIVRVGNEKDREIIEDCMNNLQKAIDENRRISHALATPNIQSEGLSVQLNHLLNDMLGTAGIKVKADFEQFDENKIDNQRKLALYRIAQEQCTNIIKYAMASEVNVLLSENDDRIYFSISDNGIGMKPDSLTKGIGLQNIAARVAIFEGKSSVLTQPGKGFSLEVELPVPAV